MCENPVDREQLDREEKPRKDVRFGGPWGETEKRSENSVDYMC